MQPVNMIMIYYWDKKRKKNDLHVLEADITTIKNIDLMCLAQSVLFSKQLELQVTILNTNDLQLDTFK